eukprot:s1428_g1.t1
MHVSTHVISITDNGTNSQPPTTNAKDLDVELSGLVLLVQPLCPTKTLEAYTLSVVPALAENRTNYTVALPNADFALNCSDEEASWQLRLEATPRSKYASASITWDDGTSQNDQNVALAVLKLPAEEVLTTMDLTVSVAAGCQCEFRTYSVQAMGLRLRFEMATPRVTKANGDEVGLDAVEDGHKMEVVVTYKSDALPAQLWNQLSLFVGPFQQVTVASPRPDLETEPLQQVYVMMTILSGAGKDLPLQLSIAGAQVGVASVQISFAPPFVTCLSAVGYGQCTTAEREQEQVFVSTVGETMLYAKGGFGGHESLASPGMLRLSVTQGGNTTELCEDSGWVSSTEMWCRLVPKGATPLVMYVLGPINQTELAEVPWSIRYQPPIIANFSEPVLQIMDGGQLYIIGQNFPDFPGEEASVGYEDAEAVRRLAGLPGAGFGTSEVCTNVVRVNQTHLLCEMKERIDLTAARCREVDLVVAWGDLRSQAQSVPILLPGPQIDTLEDMSPGLSVEVGSAILYQLRGVNFGTAGNGKIQVTMGDRPCNITSRNDGEIYCIVDGPLRDDLESLYPDPPINSSNGAVDVVVPIPVWLTLGSSSTSASEDCAPLAANWTSHAVHLLPCRAGQFRQNITNDNCTDCAPGWYTPVAGPFPTCLACVESSYAYQSGSTVCTECPAGRHTLEAASVSPLDCLCQPGFYLPAAQRQQEHQWRDEADRRRSFPILPCLPCPTGAVCAGDLSPPMSLPGWWVLPSEVPIPCTLAGCLGENQCDVGYNTRTRCETCTASYYIDLQESACAQCETWVQYFSLAYAAVFLVLLFCFLLPYLFFKARYALNPTKDVEPPWLCFGLCQCLLRRLWRKRLLHGAKGELVDIALKSEDHKVWSLARRFLGMFRGLHATPLRDLIQGAELLRVVNILLNNFQVCYMLANMSYKYWPEQAKVLLRSGMLFLNDVEQLRPDCVMQLTTTERWYLFFFLPYGLYVCALFFVLCHQRKHKARRMRITLMISGAFLLYLSPIHLLTAFKVFDCVLSGDGSWVLDLDRAVVCWEDPNWWSMFFVTAVDLSLLLILFLFLCLAVFHTYRWYRTAEVGMEPPRAVFLTWWWITGSRGVSLKHRAAICGHKVHLDLATDSLQASEINSLCDDLLDQNIGDLKSGIRRLWDYLQGFRIEHADDLSAEASNGELRPARPTSPRSGQTGPEGHHEEEPSRFSWSCCGRRVVIHKEQKLKARSDLRKAGCEVQAGDEIQWQRMDYYGVPDGSMPVYRHPVDEQPPIFEFTPTVQRVVSAARTAFKFPFNHALIQLYRSGDDSINVHSDKTLDIAHGTPIVNISFGASREFLIRSKEKVTCGTWAALRQSIVLTHNSALSFGLETNRDQMARDAAMKPPLVASVFQRPDGSIYGQGARQKSAATTPEAREVDPASLAEERSLIENYAHETRMMFTRAMFEAAYDRLTWRLEKLLVELRMMSSFSETQMNLADLLAFLWELVVLAHKTALGLIWVNTTHRPGLGLQLALAICASYFTLSLSVQPYRHRGLNVLESCFAFLNVLCVLMSMQMEYFGSNPTYENIVFALVFGYGTLGVVVLVMWTFFFAWEKTFQETYYVMMSGDFVGQGGQGDAEKPQVPGSQHELRNLPMLTRVVQSCEDLTEVEPCKARWCFHVKAPDALPTARAKHRATHERLDLSLEQAVAITVRHPKLLSRILDAEGSEVDFSACRDLGVPAGLAPGSLRRGGDLRGRIRVTVPCADQKLLRTTLRQLGAFRARCNDTKNDEDERSPRRISTVSSASAGVDTSYEAAQSTKSHVSTASRPSRVSRISATWPPPSAETAYTLEALPRPAKIAGRWVPAGAVLDVIRYVPPGASIDEAPVEFAETFLARLSRKRFGKGGVLRDSRGELILEFQRPNDPLDLHTELCELLLSRNEVPEDRREPTLDSPAHRAARIQEEHARSLLTQKAKALLKELGDFLLPLDLRFGLPTPSLSLQVSPRPDWGCMEEVLVLTRGCQQWIVQSMEIHHHLGLTSEFTVKLRRQTESLGFAPRHSVLQLMSSALAPLADESDSEDDPFEDEDAEPSLGKRTGKGSNSEGHFASRSAWRTKSGGVVFIHDFSCFGGQLELVGRPEDIKAVEKGRLLGQQVLWHPPRVATAEKALDKLWREGTDSTDCASDLRKELW